MKEYKAKEVGYIVNKNYRQKGYACETLRAVIGEAFREETHRVYAECDPCNTASWKLLEKAGLGREMEGNEQAILLRMCRRWKAWFCQRAVRECQKQILI